MLSGSAVAGIVKLGLVVSAVGASSAIPSIVKEQQRWDFRISPEALSLICGHTTEDTGCSNRMLLIEDGVDLKLESANKDWLSTRGMALNSEAELLKRLGMKIQFRDEASKIGISSEEAKGARGVWIIRWGWREGKKILDEKIETEFNKIYKIVCESRKSENKVYCDYTKTWLGEYWGDMNVVLKHLINNQHRQVNVGMHADLIQETVKRLFDWVWVAKRIN